MKKLLLIIVLLGTTCFYSQTLRYDEVKNAQKKSDIKKERILEYISENGVVFKVGDILKINKPNDGNVFSSMSIRMSIIEALGLNQYQLNNYDYNVYARTLANTTMQIKSFVIEGDKKKGFLIAANLDGVRNNIQVRLDYALEIGEIGDKKMTSDEALSQLKSEKDKFDLGLITLEQYELKKSELIKIIN